MNSGTRKLFDVVFQEAHVVDFDFSHWDRRLRLVVVAGLTPGNFDGRGPLHNVDFVDVAELSWHANHLNVKLDSPDEHCQWVIMDFNVEQGGAGERITLSGFGPTPRLEITCRDVRISELDPKVIDRLNPDWNSPAMPLARPGFEELLELRGRR
jgi:hypothetical protein